MHIHYSRSSVFYGSSEHDLRDTALAELNTFFNCRSANEDRVIYRYLLQNWYNMDNWIIWGPWHSSKIALSRTTMKFDAHWSLLKRLYLLPYNRPRVDLLVYVISTKLLPKYLSNLENVRSGVKNPNWWKQFRREWYICRESISNGVYKTNKIPFTWSCLARVRSQFFLCKHLVNNSFPQYCELNINRSPPFIKTSNCSSSKSLFANIELHESTYNGVNMVEVGHSGQEMGNNIQDQDCAASRNDVNLRSALIAQSNGSPFTSQNNAMSSELIDLLNLMINHISEQNSNPTS